MTYFHKHNDGLDEARGFLNGIILGTLLWAAIIYTLVRIFGG